MCEKNSIIQIECQYRDLICLFHIETYSYSPAENNAPFVHRCFVGTLPLREKRSGY